MRCRTAERLLSRQLDGGLTGKEHAALAGHLHRCAACRASAADFAAVRPMLSSLVTLAPSRDLAPAAGAALSEPVGFSRRTAGGWRLRLAPAGACAAAVLTIAAWSYLGTPPREAAGRLRGAHRTSHPEAVQGRLAGSVASADLRRGTRAPSMPEAAAGRSAASPSATPAASRVGAAAAPAMDDVAYVNGGREAAWRRWSALRPSEAAAMQARIDRTLRQGDDFVTVPFPQLASVDERGTAAAVAQYRQEKEVVDPRLTRPVSLAVKGMAFADLCKRLSDGSGIAISAGRTVADDKATIFCKERSLRDLMRQITHVFGYLWVRTGQSGDYRYELIQDLKGQLQEEELRARDRREALLALDREMERYRKYLDLSPEQAKEKAQGAPESDRDLLETLSGPAWAAVHMYFGLSAAEMGAMRAGKQLNYSQNPSGEELPLSQEMGSQVLQQMGNLRIRTSGDHIAVGPASDIPDGVPPAAADGVSGTAFLRMSDNDPTRVGLVGGGGFVARSPGSPQANAIMMGRPLGVGVNPSVASPENAKANARLGSDPALKASAPLAPHIAAGPAAQGGPSETAARVTSADVLEAFHTATGLDVVGDYFTRLYPAGDVSSRGARLFETLNRVCDAMHVRWHKEDGWLQFRSASFFNDRLQEIPNRLLDRWAASRKQNGASTVDDLTEMAQLTDVQLSSRDNRQALTGVYGLAEWELPSNLLVRKHLRFLAGLGPTRRAGAYRETGVALGLLTLPQQQQLVDLLQVPPEEAAALSIDDLARTSLRVLYDPKVTAEGGPSIQGPDKRLLFVYECGNPQAGRWRLEVGPNTVSRNDLRDGPGGRQTHDEERRMSGRP